MDTCLFAWSISPSLGPAFLPTSTQWPDPLHTHLRWSVQDWAPDACCTRVPSLGIWNWAWEGESLTLSSCNYDLDAFCLLCGEVLNDPSDTGALGFCETILYPYNKVPFLTPFLWLICIKLLYYLQPRILNNTFTLLFPPYLDSHRVLLFLPLSESPTHPFLSMPLPSSEPSHLMPGFQQQPPNRSPYFSLTLQPILLPWPSTRTQV